MKLIYDTPIADEWLAAARTAMQGEYTAKSLTAALMAAGAPRFSGSNSIAYRLADRLLQAERKAGRIRLVRPAVWAPVDRNS